MRLNLRRVVSSDDALPRAQILLLLVALAVAGCATTPEVSLLLGPRYSEGLTEFSATIQVRQKVGKRWECAYTHNSVVNKGPPFNGDEEITSEHPACGPTWGGRDRR